MTIEEKIKYWEMITKDIARLKEIEVTVKNDIKYLLMPYPVDSVILSKGSYHRGKSCKVLKYYLTKVHHSWVVKIVAMCIGDRGEELGPTDWDARKDPLLQEAVDLLNKLSPPEKSNDTSLIING